MTVDAFICDYVRTPIGRYGGALSSVRADDLAALPIRELLRRHPGLADKVEEVILGSANQAGEDNRNLARMALLLAGLPDSVPGVTVNRLCASGMDAVAAAARAIKAGEIDLAIAGGAESMTRAPLVMGKAESAFQRSAEVFDTTIGWRFVNPLMKTLYGVDSMPETAQIVADEHQISREDQDDFALRSQTRAAAARAKGTFDAEILPVEIKDRKGAISRVARDEHPRPETTREALAKLRGIVRPDGSVTAGNASGVNDGAAALIVASDKAVEARGLKPIARILGYATAGVAPRVMGVGPIPAVRKLCDRLKLTPSRLRRHRAQRSLRLAGARLPARTRPAGRRRARQPERRGDRARPPARHVGGPHRRRRRSGARASRRPLRARLDVRRRRSGRRTGDRAGLAAFRPAATTGDFAETSDIVEGGLNGPGKGRAKPRRDGLMTTPNHVALRKVTLHAARSKEFPQGSIRHGYDFIAPSDRRRPHRPRSLEGPSRRMFRPPVLGRRAGDARTPRPPRRRTSAARPGPSNGSPLDAVDEEEEGFRFGDHTFRAGEYVSVREAEGELLTFRVVSVGKP